MENRFSNWMFVPCLSVLLFLTVNAQEITKLAVDFPFIIEKNEHFGKQSYVGDEIYVFLKEEYFRRENLQRLFRQIVSKYPNRNIGITVFSDREELKKQMKWQAMNLSHFSPNTPFRKQFYEQYAPAETGYFRAFYFRTLIPSNESFRYSPRKNLNELIEVTLKKDFVFIDDDEFLFKSVKSGHLEAVKYYLNHKPDLT